MEKYIFLDDEGKTKMMSPVTHVIDLGHFCEILNNNYSFRFPAIFKSLVVSKGRRRKEYSLVEYTGFINMLRLLFEERRYVFRNYESGHEVSGHPKFSYNFPVERWEVQNNYMKKDPNKVIGHHESKGLETIIEIIPLEEVSVK